MPAAIDAVSAIPAVSGQTFVQAGLQSHRTDSGASSAGSTAFRLDMNPQLSFNAQEGQQPTERAK
jgi:hypothetical protein